MSLAAEYMKEREGTETLEKENGFATYKINGTQCYIIDIYVRPDFRKSGLAASMADEIAEIAKSEGCNHLLGSVDTRTQSATTSARVLFSYGFKLLKNEGFMTYFIKEML